MALALNLGSGSAQQGGQLSIDVTVTRTNYSGGVTLAAENLPTGVTFAVGNLTTNGNTITGTITLTVGHDGQPHRRAGSIVRHSGDEHPAWQLQATPGGV